MKFYIALFYQNEVFNYNPYLQFREIYQTMFKRYVRDKEAAALQDEETHVEIPFDRTKPKKSEEIPDWKTKKQGIEEKSVGWNGRKGKKIYPKKNRGRGNIEI